MFDYKKENQTKITVFANAMCKLLVRLHKNSLNPIDTTAKDCYFSVYIYFDNQVDSIDHLAFTKVHLFGYMRLIRETHITNWIRLMKSGKRICKKLLWLAMNFT